MKRNILLILIVFALFCPVFSREVLASDGTLSVYIFAKKVDDSRWLKNISMQNNEEYNFLVVVKNESYQPISGVALQIKLPEEVLYKGYISIDGLTQKKDITKFLNIGAFLPGEEKVFQFQAKSTYLGSEKKAVQINALAVSSQFQVSGTLETELEPYSFQGIKLFKNAGVAAVSFSAKQWYLWLFLIIAILIYFFRLFMYLFVSPPS